MTRRAARSLQGRRPGWEFTPLPKGFSFDAYPPVVGGPITSVAPAHVLRAARGRRSSCCRSTPRPARASSSTTAPASCRSTSRSREHPELVEPHLGTVVADDDRRLRRRERARLEGRRLRLRPARGQGRPADPADVRQRAGRHGAAPPHPDRARGGRRGRGLGAAPVRRRRGRDAAQHGRRARRRPERAPALRQRPGPQREVADLRQPARRRRPRRRARVGRARLRLGQRPRPHGHDARPAPAPRRASPAPTPRTRRQHVDYDTYQEHAAENCISNLAFRGILNDRVVVASGAG